ncbi:PEGA domain-containing protein [bacterium]|nr:PEGA domain-containing protein [FCB group bacterium]MBL7192212.1 PEGA domain-containing protein [bacterium]
MRLFEKTTELELHPEEVRMVNRGKRMVRIRLTLAVIISLVIIVSLVFLFSDTTGTLYVTSNVKGAKIFINAVETEYITDAEIIKIPYGEHIISVELAGYETVEPYAKKVKITAGRTDTVNFVLIPKEK